MALDDWLERYARQLGVPPLGDEETAALLDLAREVAHGSQRRFAPLSAFLAGVLVGAQAGEENEAVRLDTIRRAAGIAEQLLDEQQQ